MSETEQLLISPDVVEQPAPELPGHRLREAREALGLSCHDVAQALKFSARQVEALERDDYSSLQGATFVRGFIRSYCRFLKLDPEPLLGLLTRDAPQETPEIVAPSNMGEATPRPFVERNRKWLVAAALLMLATIGLYVFVSSEFAASNEFRLSQQSHSAEQVVAPPAVTPVTPAEAPSVVAPQPVTAPAAGEAPAAPAPSASAPSPMPVTVAAAPVAAAAAPSPAPGERQLNFEFVDRSWVEIKDSRNRVILTGEYSAGAKQVAIGRPPFQLWVGKASGVKVTDGDRKIDLGPHARDEVARLTIE